MQQPAHWLADHARLFLQSTFCSGAARLGAGAASTLKGWHQAIGKTLCAGLD
jgi:hypothetical protein